MTPTIRLARLEDVSRLREIYRYYVEETAVTFDYEVPSQEEFAARMQDIQSFYPYLVAEEAGQIMPIQPLFMSDLLMLGQRK